MRCGLCGSLLTAGVLLLTGQAGGGEPFRLFRVAPQATAVVPTAEFVRPDPYDVWQNYAVDRYGRFRPRVAEYADGLRYVSNGQPYPWAMNYPQNAAPVVSQAANFAEEPRPAVRVVGFTPAPVTTTWERMPHVRE